jgi:hypothetical protein
VDDEGFDTFMNIYSQRAWYVDRLGRENWTHWTDPKRQRFIDRMGPERRIAIVAAPDLYWPGWRGFLGYGKPARGLAILRDVILGRERFDLAFGTFTRRWAFKHPQPADFFDRWKTPRARTCVVLARMVPGDRHAGPAGGGCRQPRADRAVLTVRNNEGLVLPVPFRVWYSDGSVEDRQLPAEIWRATDEWAAAWDTRGRTVVGLRIDADVVLPDAERGNNDWGVVPDPGGG